PRADAPPRPGGAARDGRARPRNLRPGLPGVPLSPSPDRHHHRARVRATGPALTARPHLRLTDGDLTVLAGRGTRGPAASTASTTPDRAWDRGRDRRVPRDRLRRRRGRLGDVRSPRAMVPETRGAAADGAPRRSGRLRALPRACRRGSP